MPNIYFAPIHVADPEASAAINEQLSFLQEWGVHVKNTEIRDPAMLEHVDGMIAEFSYGDPKVESEVLRARTLGKPVLAMASAKSGLYVPESVAETAEQGGLMLNAHNYSAPNIAISAMKVFLGAHLGYHGPAGK